MKENSVEELERSMIDCLERAEACTVDAADDYFMYLDRANKIGELLVEREKAVKEQEFNERKYEESKDWKTDWKFWVQIGVPVLTQIFCMAYDRHTLMMHTRTVCEFEQTNTFTTQAGKGIGGSLRLPPILHKRG